MLNLTEKFLDFLNEHGISPTNSTDIIADDNRNRYHVAGDKPRTLNGSYQLKIVDGKFAVGWAMTFKNGTIHKFTSSNFRNLSIAEKEEYAKKADVERKKKQRERETLALEAQKKAQHIWDKAAKIGDNGYLKRKQSDMNGARFYNNMIIIPAYIDGKISTLQCVLSSGDKRFIKNGNLEGAYFPIAKKDDDKSILLLCEGFATGDAIRKATGLPTIVCFNANNLKPVAKAMRAKYPNAKLLYCADNDKFTVINGEQVNVGILKAQAAAVANGGGMVIYPEFEDNEEKKYSDFNDAFVAKGLEYVKNRIELAIVGLKASTDDSMGGGVSFSGLNPVVEQQSVALSATQSILPVGPDPDWRAKLFYDDKMVLVKNHLANAALYLFNHAKLAGAFVFDEFNMQVAVQKDITGFNSEFKVHPLGDGDIMQLCIFMERNGLIKDERKVGSLVNYVASQSRINPAVDYFNTLKWDGVERLRFWLAEAFGADEPEEYLSAIGRKWLTAGVKRVFQPGCKFDHMLMLEGLQGAGKSSALELLAALGCEIKDPNKQEPESSYYTDALTFDNIGDKDCMMLTTGAIMVVLEELVGKNKKSDDDIKRWITLKKDKGRLPYARFVTEIKRQFILAGTTNNSDYLKDPTGNRRYWPIECTKVDKVYINDNREQMWAEAVYLYKQNLYLGLEGKEIELAQNEQAKRLEEDVWERAVKDALVELAHKNFLTSDLLDKMNVALKDQDSRAAIRVKNILKKLGYENKPMRYDGKVERRWVNSAVLV